MSLLLGERCEFKYRVQIEQDEDGGAGRWRLEDHPHEVVFADTERSRDLTEDRVQRPDT